MGWTQTLSARAATMKNVVLDVSHLLMPARWLKKAVIFVMVLILSLLKTVVMMKNVLNPSLPLMLVIFSTTDAKTETHATDLQQFKSLNVLPKDDAMESLMNPTPSSWLPKDAILRAEDQLS